MDFFLVVVVGGGFGKGVDFVDSGEGEGGMGADEFHGVELVDGGVEFEDLIGGEGEDGAGEGVVGEVFGCLDAEAEGEREGEAFGECGEFYGGVDGLRVGGSGCGCGCWRVLGAR